MFPAKPSEVVNAGVSVISHAEMLYFERFLTKKSIPEEWKKKENPESSSEYWDAEIKKIGLDTLLDAMKKKGTILDATLTVYSTMIKKDPKSRWKGEISTRITKLAHEKGVKVCTGTDSDDLFVNEELKILVKFCGFSEIEAIIAGTINSAEAIGIEKTHGTIEKDKMADLVILNKNPLEDIRNIDDIYMVIKSGMIYKKE
jgi:imidazolonepropionase-like amidohydrolase